MRSVWSCSSCVVLLLSALFGSETAASHVGRQRKDVLLDRIAKAQVTAHPARRDEGGSCSVDHVLCPASLNGGCCPSLHACATDYCYATAAAPTTACARPGYAACAAEEGGKSRVPRVAIAISSWINSTTI